MNMSEQKKGFDADDFASQWIEGIGKGNEQRKQAPAGAPPVSELPVDERALEDDHFGAVERHENEAKAAKAKRPRLAKWASKKPAK